MSLKRKLQKGESLWMLTNVILIGIESKLWGRCREVDLRIEPLIVVDKDDPAGFRNMVKRTGIHVYP